MTKEENAGEVRAQIVLVLAIGNAVMTKKYCSPKISHSDNMRYSFRVWLLNLGLIGEKFKNCRTHLLKQLSGNITWRHPEDAIAQRERLKQESIVVREQRNAAVSSENAESDTVPDENPEGAVSDWEGDLEEEETEDMAMNL